LVSLPVRLYNAVSSSSRVSFNQLHSKTHRRLKQQLIEPELGPVDRTDIVKGYEYEKEKYVIVDEADFEKVRLETTRFVDIMQFIDADELDPMYLDNPYYVAPDGPVAEDAFRVIREAMKAKNRVGIGRVVMNGREHIVAIRPQDKGFVMTTLRYASEVRGSETYFEEIREAEVNKAQLQLAEQLIEGMTDKFDPSQFNDRYQDALLEIIKAKIEGAEPIVAPEIETGTVINLMDALKQSLAAAPKKPPAKSIAKKEEKKTATKKRKLA
jgi:DNA end-binding protein Ku